MLSKEKLLLLDRQGFILGPKENEQDFLNRAQACLKNADTISKVLKEHNIPLHMEELADSKDLQNALKQTNQLFKFKAEWIPCFYSNKKLCMWHGGVSWILTSFVILQLRQSFKKAKKHFIYDKNEIISHEMAHAGRQAFNEPIFEEIIAYQTTKNCFRRYFGPIIRSQMEIFIFFLTVLVTLGTNFYMLAFNKIDLYDALHWLNYLPVALIGFAILRLAYYQNRFKKCYANLTKLFRSKKKAMAITYRLSDKEILNFAKMPPKKTKDFINNKNEPRWQLMREL